MQHHLMQHVEGLGCVFRFLFRFLTGLIFGIRGIPRITSDSAEHRSELNHSRARLICSGIRRNPEFRPEFWREGPLSTALYATCNKHSACGLKHHKKQVSAMAFCLLLLPLPAASHCTVLPPLLPLLAVSVTVAVATVSFAAALS